MLRSKETGEWSRSGMENRNVSVHYDPSHDLCG